MGSSWPKSTPTTIGSYSAPIQATDAQTYGHEQRRRSDSSASNSSRSLSNSTSASGERTTTHDFQYDWESVYPGFHLEDVNWKDPRPLADSPLNPRIPGFYSGPKTSRLVAGAGAGEADMGDVADPWGGGSPTATTRHCSNRLLRHPIEWDQLIQQVALLRDENLQLHNDVADLQQRMNQ